MENTSSSQDKLQLQRDIAYSEASSFRYDIRNKVRDLKKAWNAQRDQLEREITQKNYRSEAELQADIRNLIAEQRKAGRRFDDLISSLSDRADMIMNRGGDYRSMDVLVSAMDEILAEIPCLDLVFTQDGLLTDMGIISYEISAYSANRYHYWSERLASTPEKRLEKQQKDAQEALEKAKVRLENVETAEKEMREKLQTQEEEVERLQKLFDEKTASLPDDEQEISASFEEELHGKEDALEQKKKELEQHTDEYESAQIELASLSFLRGHRKKQLREKIPVLLDENDELDRQVRAASSELRLAKNRKDQALIALSKALEDLEAQLQEAEAVLEDDRAELHDLEKQAANARIACRQASAVCDEVMQKTI